MSSVDGIWGFEVSGIYGWERVSTIYLEKGRFLGGGAIMFSHGTYVVDGKNIEMTLEVTQHGKEQTVFGEKRKNFSTLLNAKIKGKVIQGQAHLIGARSNAAQYHFRMLRLGDIPPFPKKKRK
jgi:hypothetical protein